MNQRVQILPEKLMTLIRRSGYFYRPLKKIRMFFGRLVSPRRFPEIMGGVHFNDDQLPIESNSGVKFYKDTGLGAIDLIEDALKLSGRNFESITSCLDLGCGYGRVLRYLHKKIDPRNITACDINREAVQFCKKEFGVKALFSKTDFRKVQFDTYDLIWIGSLFTHLSEEYTLNLIKVLGEILAEEGILVFTIQSEKNLEKKSRKKNIDPLKNDFNKKGIAFLPYGYYQDKNIGLTWHSHNYILKNIDAVAGGGLHLLKFSPNGWMGSQDVFSFRRLKTPNQNLNTLFVSKLPL